MLLRKMLVGIVFVLTLVACADTRGPGTDVNAPNGLSAPGAESTVTLSDEERNHSITGTTVNTDTNRLNESSGEGTDTATMPGSETMTDTQQTDDSSDD